MLVVARDDTDSQRTKILALENAWNEAEEHKDTGALGGLLAATLVYIDYDGTLMNKAQFMASVKAPSLYPDQIVNESMTEHSGWEAPFAVTVYCAASTNITYATTVSNPMGSPKYALHLRVEALGWTRTAFNNKCASADDTI